MYVCNIRLELQMEIEQRYVVGCLHCNGMKLPAIVTELVAVYHKDAIAENRVKYWLHEVKLHRSDLSERPNSGRPALEDIDALILQVWETEPCFSVRTIAEFLKIPASKVHLHLTTFLNIKSRDLKWIPHFVDDDLTAKRLYGTRQLLEVL
jgi:transposase